MSKPLPDQSESVCVDCGQPLRGDVLRECANPTCPMYGGDVALEERSRAAAEDTDRRDGREFGEGDL